MLPILHEFDYVLLHATLPTARERIFQRAVQSSARANVLDHMFPQFDKIKETYHKHVINRMQADIVITIHHA
jgi:hypothetical protein